MEKEKYCPTCDNYDRCIQDYKEESGYCDYYIIKPLPMENKVIFESEEEARRIISIMDIPESKTEINIKILRTQGYIRKSAIEEAEEAFKDWKSSHSLGSNDIDVMNSVLKKANTYIEFLYKGFQEQNKIIEKKDDIIRNLVIECQELKSEIKRLKK